MEVSTLRDNLTRGVAALTSGRGLTALRELAAARQVQVYLVGGTVRELALGRSSPDLDVAVSAHALDLARDLARELEGTFVLLDERERTARVVARGETLDLAEFRAPTLEADLRARDFTVNALALDLDALLAEGNARLIDPWGGLQDLAQGILRIVRPENFGDDPLRLLRAYRFAATHGFRLTPETSGAISHYLPGFSRIAGERVRQELYLLLEAPGAAPVLAEMDHTGLLDAIFPEMSDLRGVAQDGYHHLDVFHHSLETLRYLEEVLAAPQNFFGALAAEVDRYGGLPHKTAVLKLAALFHDAGKPQVQERRQEPDRYTFYYHEKVGMEIWTRAAQRLRLSHADTRTVLLLIQSHMRPFLLLPAFRQGTLAPRALGRLVRAIRPELPGCFALAMADSLAGQGPQKPSDSETVLADLAEECYRFLKERLEPQELEPRLLSGDDLIQVLGLTPGPEFRRLLTAVEEAQWEGRVRNRQEALDLVRLLF